MRRRTLRLVTLTFLLVITLSYATVLLAKSPAPDTSLIIQKLQQLQGDVNDLPADAFKNTALAENKQNTLENKLGAVIHQIQAGAFNGSINKLENDLKNSITNWITPEQAQDLIQKIDEIIDLIKGKKPPQPTPDFTLTASPNPLTIVQNSSAQSTITVQSINGFNQTVSLNVTSAPITHVTTTLSQPQVTPPANGTANTTLTVKAALDAQPGNYTITVSGTNGTLKRAVNITLTITQVVTVPDFTITAYPHALIVQQGSSNTSLITVNSLAGFNQSVTLTITSTHIAGVNTAVQPSPVIPAPNQSALSILTVQVANTTAVGNYAITVTGTSGSLQHSVDVTLTVTEITPEKPKDTTAPTIATVQRTPVQPTYNQTVVVTAFVYDVESGVKQVTLNYSRGSNWTLANMTLTEGLYKAVIPAFAFNITVEYRVSAIDNAGNQAYSSLFSYRVTDPYPPVIGLPYWLPKEPAANVDVQVNVTVFEPAYGSGVANVTLQFKNGTMDEWLSVPMTLKDGNWTATLGNQSDTLVEFFLVAFDKAGNRNETDSFEFTVAASAGFPLLWLLIIIIILLAILIGGAAYLYVRRRRKKREGEGAKVPPTMPPSSPGVEVSKPVGVAAVPAAASVAALAPVPSRGFGMVSFLVAAHNEEGTISGRIGKAFERAAAHKGSSEVIVVDDGSLDGTYELAWEAVKANRAKYPNIPAKMVKLSTYMGKEEAIRFGSRKATGEIIETVNGENTPSLPALMGHLLLTL